MNCPNCGSSFQVRVGGSSVQRSPTSSLQKSQQLEEQQLEPQPARTPSSRAPLALASNPAQPKQPAGSSPSELVDLFVRRVLQSELLTQGDIDDLLKSLPERRRPRNVNDLAGELVRAKKLTVFQAKEICAGRGNSLVLGNYVVMDKLGDGGMGLVVKANHRRMDRTVALKLLSPSLTKTPEAVQRFHREAKAAAKLDHQNIVTAYDADECRGTHFLVMQYVEGSDLSAIVREKGPLTPEVAASCVEQAARGLQYAHQRGVVHRDIKPSNLLMDAEGTVRILDMGLARIESGGSEQDQLTGTGMIMGTVDFMAPEQAVDTKTVDGRADIYSLGATLWYLVTGRAMYESETVIKKLMSHQNGPIPSLREACPDASPALGQVFARMVAKNADDRFQSMSEVITELERIRSSGRTGTSTGVSASQTDRMCIDVQAARRLLDGVSPESASHAVKMQLRDSSSPTLDVTVTMLASLDDTDRSLSTRQLAAPISKSLKMASPFSARQNLVWSVGAVILCVLALVAFVWSRWGH